MRTAACAGEDQDRGSEERERERGAGMGERGKRDDGTRWIGRYFILGCDGFY